MKKSKFLTLLQLEKKMTEKNKKWYQAWLKNRAAESVNDQAYDALVAALASKRAGEHLHSRGDLKKLHLSKVLAGDNYVKSIDRRRYANAHTYRVSRELDAMLHDLPPASIRRKIVTKRLFGSR